MRAIILTRASIYQWKSHRLVTIWLSDTINVLNYTSGGGKGGTHGFAGGLSVIIHMTICVVKNCLYCENHCEMEREVTLHIFLEQRIYSRGKAIKEDGKLIFSGIWWKHSFYWTLQRPLFGFIFLPSSNFY